MFDVGTYTMRNGGAAQVVYRLPATDQEQVDYPLGGYFWSEWTDEWEHGCWDENGYCISFTVPSENDLMPPRREYWVNEYGGDERGCHKTPEDAEAYRLDQRKECVHVVELRPNEKIVLKEEG